MWSRRGDPVSEAALDRTLGTAEDMLAADGARPLVGVRPDGPGDVSLAAPAAAEHATLDRRRSCNCIARAVAVPALVPPLFSRTVSQAAPEDVVPGHDRGRATGFAPEPALYVFNHLSWMDPLALLATFPNQPRLHFYGPKEVDLQKGVRNRFMWWTTIPIPFSPLKDDLLTSVRRAQAVFDSGALAGDLGRGPIHIHEGDLLPFEEGAAYLALRAGVPIVPGRDHGDVVGALPRARRWSASASRSRRGSARRARSSPGTPR